MRTLPGISQRVQLFMDCHSAKGGSAQIFFFFIWHAHLKQRRLKALQPNFQLISFSWWKRSRAQLWRKIHIVEKSYWIKCHNGHRVFPLEKVPEHKQRERAIVKNGINTFPSWLAHDWRKQRTREVRVDTIFCFSLKCLSRFISSHRKTLFDVEEFGSQPLKESFWSMPTIASEHALRNPHTKDM